MLGDILGEILATVFEALLPERVLHVVLGLVLVLACVAFAALGAFKIYQVLTQQAKLVQSLLALLFLGLSACSARFAWKCFRSR